MKTRAVLIAIGMSAATMTSAAAHAQQSKHEEAFCAALTRFRADVATLQSTQPSSTMAEFRASADRVAKDADDLQRAASKINSATAKQFTTSTRRLRNEIQAMPPNVTVAHAKSRIHGDVQNVQQSAQQLASESRCPEATPGPQQSQGPQQGAQQGSQRGPQPPSE